MKRVTFVLTALILSGLIISATAAFSMPSTKFSGLSMPSMGSQALSQGLSVSSPQISSQPGMSSFGSNSPLRSMQFFGGNKAQATPQSTGAIPSSDIGPIMQMFSQLPSPSSAQQYYSQQGAATPTPTPAPKFSDVSNVIPADQVIFIEVSKSTTLVDPSTGGITMPQVTMSWKYSDKTKQIILKKKNNTDYNASQLIFGYSEDNDQTGQYLFDYGIGSCPSVDIPVIFTGADGRISIMLNGEQKDIMPGKQAQVLYTEGNTRTSITVTNDGLVPRSNVQVVDKL